jgi:hypothetical protein
VSSSPQPPAVQSLPKTPVPGQIVVQEANTLLAKQHQDNKDIGFLLRKGVLSFMAHSLRLGALLPPGRQRSAKVKVFLDFMAQSLNLAQWRTLLAKRSA